MGALPTGSLLAYDQHLSGQLPSPPCFTFVFCFKSSFDWTICPLRAASESPAAIRRVNGTQQKLKIYLWNEWVDVITTRKTRFLQVYVNLMFDTLGQLEFFSDVSDRKKQTNQQKNKIKQNHYNPNCLRQKGRFMVSHNHKVYKHSFSGSKARTRQDWVSLCLSALSRRC